MRFDLLTLFPELVQPQLEIGITRRAFASGQVQVRCWNPRDFTEDNYRRVDDRPFGGGPGMVMLVEPLERALAAAQADARQPAPVIHFSPAGARHDPGPGGRDRHGPGAVLVCGRYEGIDQRFIARHVTLEISLGDFVLSGGELPALALLDAVARLQPGVLGDAASHQQDSFQGDGLLDCPHYSRPERWATTRCPPCCCPATTPDRTLAPRAVAAPDPAAPARSDRRGRARGRIARQDRREAGSPPCWPE
jgi:tRNA (guanine37-N1)-methyltransferase